MLFSGTIRSNLDPYGRHTGGRCLLAVGWASFDELAAWLCSSRLHACATVHLCNFGR